MLVKHIAAVPIYLQPFPSNSTRKFKVRHFNTFFAHSGLPEYAPGTIALNVTWMEKGFNSGKSLVLRKLESWGYTRQ